jgi:hypothetical protein
MRPMIHNRVQYRALERVYLRRKREVEKLQEMLFSAGATVENVRTEMAPYFQAVTEVRLEFLIETVARLATAK